MDRTLVCQRIPRSNVKLVPLRALEQRSIISSKVERSPELKNLFSQLKSAYGLRIQIKGRGKEAGETRLRYSGGSLLYGFARISRTRKSKKLLKWEGHTTMAQSTPAPFLEWVPPTAMVF